MTEETDIVSERLKRWGLSKTVIINKR